MRRRLQAKRMIKKTDRVAEQKKPKKVPSKPIWGAGNNSECCGVWKS